MARRKYHGVIVSRKGTGQTTPSSPTGSPAARQKSSLLSDEAKCGAIAAMVRRGLAAGHNLTGELGSRARRSLTSSRADCATITCRILIPAPEVSRITEDSIDRFTEDGRLRVIQ